ncbi:MAG: tail fiber domain-containing protein [Spirochaetes bacterium]|nr:MAG: tail fiber domain-containing protein [Spirochaetota bacterium]
MITTGDIYGGGDTTQYLHLNTNNYNSYAPTLTGGNASGTWGINVTGSAGSVAWGNVSSKPGNLVYWDTWYGSAAYLGSDGNLYMGWAGAWLSSWLNQSVKTDSAPTFRDVYTSGWFRNYGLHGLYNEDYGNFWYARSDSYWTLAGNNGSAVGIQLRTGGHEGSLRGYVYANSSNEIGFLNTSGSWSLRCDNSGNVTATADLIAYSDARLKENIETIDNALQKVVSLRGVSYNRIDTEDKSTKLGLVAQEVQAVLPEVVYEQEDGILGVSYGNIVGVLIEAMKEQQAMIETLEAKIELLTKFLK